MGHSAADIQKQVKIYMFVFATLAILTIVTVSVSYLELPFYLAIAVTLFIAAMKGGLVAAYFMHLISERHLIHYILILTLVFFIALMVLPVMTDFDSIHV